MIFARPVRCSVLFPSLLFCSASLLQFLALDYIHIMIAIHLFHSSTYTLTYYFSPT